MRLTSKQALQLIQVLHASFEIPALKAFSMDQRRKLYYDIQNQQSNKVIDLDEDVNNDE